MNRWARNRLCGYWKSPYAWLVLALILAAGLKTWLIIGEWAPFNADEAVVALMARHILRGELPVFFYGQAYMGSLDACLIASGFWLFGEQVWVIRLVQSLLYLGFLMTTFALGRLAFNDRRVGAIAILLLALPPVNLTLYTTVSLGGYGEVLLLGNLTLISVLQIWRSFQEGRFPGQRRWWLLVGLSSGLGLWAFGLTLVYSLPAGVFLFILTWKALRTASPPSRRGITWAFCLAVMGSLIGSTPWWLFALQNGVTQLLKELGGEAIAGVEGLPWGVQLVTHTFNLLVFGSTAAIGVRPPWGVIWLGLPILPFVLFFWMAVLVYLGRSLSNHPQAPVLWLLAGVIGTLALGFILTPFGVDSSGRYFLPWAAPLALLAADFILSIRGRVGLWAFTLVGLLMMYQLWGVLQSALRYPPGLTTQFYAPTQVDQRYMPELITFLRDHGEWRGYTNYWVAYPLAFLSNEKLIYTPRLPYHLDFRYTRRDDRYPPYDTLVAQAERTAYITTNHPQLNQRLRQEFRALGVSWQETTIGDFQVFYALSRAVHPEELGLGETTHP